MPADVSNTANQPLSATRSGPAVTDAIRRASKSTGANFNYLLATAKVESDLNPNLTMRSSSATGLFQIIDQTWLGVMKTAGRAFGYARYADAITETSSGRYEVADPKLRQDIMKLRLDPAANAAMGGVLTRQNEAVVADRIGRKPTEGELYIAHFFGPYAGSTVIQLASSNPSANAAAMFPAAARANGPIFYDRQGNPRSVAGVYAELSRRYQAAKASPTVVATAQTTPVVPPKTRAPVADTAGITMAFAASQSVSEPLSLAAPHPFSLTSPNPLSTIKPIVPAAAGEDSTSVFYSLFETSQRTGPVSPAIAELRGADGAGKSSAAPLDLFQDSAPSVRKLFRSGS